MTPKTFIFAGRSGSGKGTQIQLLKKYMTEQNPETGSYLFVMGETLRTFMKDEGYAQETIRSIINGGNLVPSVISGSLFVANLLHNLKEKDTLFIDGIPRSATQSDIMISILDFYKRKDTFIINIEVTPEEVEKRMLLRGRPDDTHEGITARLAFYESTVIPAITHLKDASGFTYIEINGNRSIEEIHLDLVSKLKGVL